MANTKRTLKELLAEVRLKLAEQQPTDPTQQTDTYDGVEFKGKDGASYRVKKMEVGEAVEIADADGKFSPAPDGEIEAEDGSKITVTSGKIEVIKPADVQPTDETSPIPPNGGFKAEDFVTKEAFQALEGKFETALQTINKLNETLSQNKGQVSAMFELVEAIANESEETPTEASKVNTFTKIKSEKDAAKAKLKEAFLAK